MSIYRLQTTQDEELLQFLTSQQLDGAVYQLRYDYNTRDASWYLSLLTQESIPIISGRRLTGNGVVNELDPAFTPPGIIACRTIAEPLADPTQNSLQTTHQMVYFDAAELAGGA